MIRMPWHRHRWGPWELATGEAYGLMGGAFRVVVQVRVCLDPGCHKVKIERL